MDLTEFRQRKDDFFRSVDSPLLPEQRATFGGLRYFSAEPSLRFQATLEAPVSDDWLTMPTSTGDQRRYRRAGTISFQVHGEPVKFTIFQDDQGLFLPFRDGTSQDESYAAGRYLEPERVDDQTVMVDFNLAYNPYCAYNEQYSCPIPPSENWTKARIDAGEKKFHS
jgi:uncharacterized protein